MDRELTASPRDGASIVARVAAATLLAQLVVAAPLFFPDGWLAPIGPLPLPLAWILSGALGLVAALVALGVRPRVTVPLLAALLLLRCAPDRALWQAYLLEALALLALAAGGRLRGERWDEPMRWVIGLVFVWAGLHKLNPTFLDHGMGWVARTLGLDAAPPALNVATALAEVALGVGLLVPRTRRVAGVGLLLFGAAVALTLAIRGHNRVVIPWNVGHAALAIALFLPRAEPSPAPRAALAAVLVVFGALPLAYPLGWPPYLALRLYTASSTQGWLFVDDLDRLPPEARAVGRPDPHGDHRRVISIEEWAHERTGAFLPPEPAVFEAIHARACDRLRGGAVLVVEASPEWWADPGAPETHRCGTATDPASRASSRR